MAEEWQARMKRIDGLVREGRVDEARKLCKSRAEELQVTLSHAHLLAEEGKYQEALERYVCFHENSVDVPGLAGVRVSFALMYWKKLGEVYPPAMTAFVETRDRKAREIAGTGGTRRLFGDVMAFNRKLGDEQATIDLFALLDQKHPEQACDYWESAKDTLLSAKQFDLIRKYGFDPAIEFESVAAHFSESPGGLPSVARFGPLIAASLQRFHDQKDRFVEKTLLIITTAKALGDEEGAAEVREMAIQIVDDPRLREGG